jgi:predicted membrane protein
MDKIKTLETSLVLTTGFLILFLIFGNLWLLYLALVFGVIGIFVKPLAKLIAKAWFKLADILNFFVSRLVLGTLFFAVLWPVSVLYKISNKDKLRIKRSGNSNWIKRNHKYSSADLENIW